MGDPVIAAMDRVAAARERDHECECDCADKLRDLAQDLAALVARYMIASLGDGSDECGEPRLQAAERLLKRARTAGLV